MEGRSVRVIRFNPKTVTNTFLVQVFRGYQRAFKGVPHSGCQPVPVGQPRPYLVNVWPKFAKSPQHAQNHALGALLVATNFLNIYIYKFYQNWIKIG